MKITNSLQPTGFVLYDILEYKKPKLKIKNNYEIAVVPKFPIIELKTYLSSIGIKARFTTIEIDELKKAQSKPNKFDFLIFSFGVADPSPVTWLSLVLESEINFIGDYDGKVRTEFQTIKKNRSPQERIAKLKFLMKQAGETGLYSPLAHYSSIAVGNSNIDFSNIFNTDETVDITKLRIV